MSETAKTGSRWAACAAAGWILLGLDSIIRPRPLNIRDVLWIAPFVATIGALWHAHAVQKARAGRAERWAFYAVVLASALALIGMFGIIAEAPSLELLAFPGGAIIWTAGLIWFGAATWRARVFPAYVGIALILLEPGSILTGVALSPISPLSDHGGYSAGIEKGAVMALLALGFRAVIASDHRVRNADRQAVSLAR